LVNKCKYHYCAYTHYKLRAFRDYLEINLVSVTNWMV
jgi:hypothetical protein